MEKSHFKQAEFWLMGAKYLFDFRTEDSEKYAVVVAMAIHTIIKANDSLTIKFLNTTARRHEDARRLFEDLIRNNLIPSDLSQNKQIIQDAITYKAKAEYKGDFFSKKDAQEMLRKAEKFLEMAEKLI